MSSVTTSPAAVATSWPKALDAKWPGSVPYTILVALGGKIIYRGLNEIKPLELKQAIVEYSSATYANR